jgi:hypothetical protein
MTPTKVLKPRRMNLLEKLVVQPRHVDAMNSRSEIGGGVDMFESVVTVLP